MDCSTPGFPVHHRLLELTQTHVHQLSDAIQPSHPLRGSESALCIRWPKYWSFSFSISPSNGYSGLISFRMDWLDLLDPTLKSLPRLFKSLLQESSPTSQFKSISSSMLSILYIPTLTSIHDHWKKHSFD